MKSKLQYIAAMTAFGTIALFVRNIPLSSATVALMRAVIATAFLLVLGLVTGNPVRLKRIGRDALPLFLSGAAMGFNWILLFEAYKYTSVSIATLCYYFAPVIVTVVSAIAFREKLSKKQILCFTGCTAGLVLVIGVSTAGASFTGVAFGLGAAVLYATVILLNKRIKNVSGTDRTLLQFVAAAIVLTPYLLLTEGLHFEQMTPVSWVWMAIVGLFHTGIVYWMYFSSLRDLRGQQAAILSYIDPLVAVVISCTILREPTSALQLFGGAMILGFTLLNEIGGENA